MKLLAALALLLFVSPAFLWSADLTVMVHGLRSDQGILRVALFDSEQGFPSDASVALAHQSLKLASAKRHPIAVVFRNLTEKKYAVSVFHDENANTKLEMNALGMPQEGTGTSNNTKGFMGPPRFKQAAFDLGKTNDISITVSY